MIKITPLAAEKILAISASSDTANLALRIAAKVGPDGKYEYGMGFDERAENDLYLVCEGVAVVMTPHTGELVEDAIIDYVEIEAGTFDFIFYNPNDPDHKPPKTS